ncbi:hypothetical protein HDZ31DRAFT_9329, partial [Schizophyllum fasciatum]
PSSAHPSHDSANDTDMDGPQFAPRSFMASRDVIATLEEKYPIQYAVDPPCDASLGPFAPAHLQPRQLTMDEAVAVVHAAHARDPALLHVADAHGFTPIYAAAAVCALPVMRALLAYGVPAAEILSRQNVDRKNAIEEFERARNEKWLVDGLMRREVVDREGLLEVAYLLRQAAGENLPSLADFKANAQ